MADIARVPDKRHRVASRGVVARWYLLAVMLPLFLTVASPAWVSVPLRAKYGANPGPQGNGMFLAAGWVPWLIAAAATVTLLIRFPWGESSLDKNGARWWNIAAWILLVVTGLAGLGITALGNLGLS